MQTISYMPQMLKTAPDQDIHSSFRQYKRNVKIFVEKMKEEVCQLINQYEKIICGLRNENQRLKEGLPSKQFIRSSHTPYNMSTQSPFTHSHPSPNPRSVLDAMQTAKSQLITQDRPQLGNMHQFSPILRSKNEEDFCSSGEINPQGLQATRFQINSKRRRNRQQEIRHFLESGSKSMNRTTQRFKQVVGRGKDRKIHDDDSEMEEDTKEKKSECESKNESGLNKSLGLICESLDSSFISERSRSARKKQELKKKEETERKWNREIQLRELSKQKNIKNLLHRLRQNVESSPTQIVKRVNGSNLIPNKEPPTELPAARRNSKVMINPVPINIEKKSKVLRREQERSPSTPSPDRKPQSILKQSTTILTRSIAGGSAFDFS